MISEDRGGGVALGHEEFLQPGPSPMSGPLTKGRTVHQGALRSASSLPRASHGGQWISASGSLRQPAKGAVSWALLQIHLVTKPGEGPRETVSQ